MSVITQGCFTRIYDNVLTLSVLHVLLSIKQFLNPFERICHFFSNVNFVIIVHYLNNICNISYIV